MFERSYLYYLYIDESGDTGDYRAPNGTIIEGSSRYFTLGGIIVDDQLRIDFENKVNQLVRETFLDISLPKNFKLHYQPLRQKAYPYDHISDQTRWAIPEKVFSWIRNSNCRLLSVTIDLDKHCQYERPVDPRAYALLLILERFQYFLEDNHETGIAIYEKFNAKLRKKAENELRWLRNIPTFPKPTNFSLLDGKVRNGDPMTEPVLQIADFFAYLPWLKKTTDGKATDKFDSVVDKYYNLGGGTFRKGLVEI